MCDPSSSRRCRFRWAVMTCADSNVVIIGKEMLWLEQMFHIDPPQKSASRCVFGRIRTCGDHFSFCKDTSRLILGPELLLYFYSYLLRLMLCKGADPILVIVLLNSLLLCNKTLYKMMVIYSTRYTLLQLTQCSAIYPAFIKFGF